MSSAATDSTSSSAAAAISDGFLPRNVVVENFIQDHLAQFQLHIAIITNLVRSIDLYRNRGQMDSIPSMLQENTLHRAQADEHRRLLEEYRAEQAQFHSPSAAAADDDEESSEDDDLDPTITATFDIDTVRAGNVEVLVLHHDHPYQLYPDKFSFRFARGTKVSYLKDNLVDIHFGQSGWTSREMSLMTSAVNELDDDDAVGDNAELTLKTDSMHHRRQIHH